LALSASIRAPLRNQQAAAAWAGQSGERFAQVSVFFPVSVEFNEERIHKLRADVDSALLEASLESTPRRTLYTDAWSAEGTVILTDTRGRTVPAKAIGVGGDFFLFHPLYLRDGAYLSPNDVMRDRVVLDEELAWRLFGAVRIAGFEITINNIPFVVSGVVARESDFASSRAYDDGAGLFMSFEALSEMSDGMASISCYEIVMPDPLTGFAIGVLTDIFSDSDVHIVENSARFSLAGSFAAIGSFGERSIMTDTIAFPYWENAARFAEDWLALLLALSLLFIVFPIVNGVIYLVKIIRFFVKQGRRTVSKAIKEHDKREYEKYLLEHDGEHQIYSVDEIIREVRDET